MAITRYETGQYFVGQDRKAGHVSVGADYVMVIEGYEHLTFSIKTNGLPTLKDDKIEYSTTHGVKTVAEGRVQTLNDIQVTFMNRDQITDAKDVVEEIILKDLNDNLKVSFYKGRKLDDMKPYGKMVYASIFVEDTPEADTEATTTPQTYTVSISGHYEPAESRQPINLQNLLG